MARIGKTVGAHKRKPSLLEAKPRACRECNGHKIFCTKDKPKCDRCRLRSLECVYTSPKKIKVNEDNLRSLKKRLQVYKDLFKSLPPDVMRSLPAKPEADSVLPDSNDDDDDDGDDPDDENATGDVFSDDLKHIGLESPSGLENQQSSENFFQIVTKLSGLRGEDGEDGEDSEDDEDGGRLGHNPVFYAYGALPSRRMENSYQPPIALPPIDIARQYFAAQHMYIGTIFAFSDPDTFDRQLKAAYASGPPAPNDAQACLAYAKIFLILAMGRLYSVNRRSCSGTGHDEQDDPPGFSYFLRGLALLPDLHEEGSILGVETLAYVGYFMQNLNRRDAAYLYIGLALRMAITLGLHREAATARLTEADREHRRRVWWSIYSLDRILSLKSGNPTSILDGDIGARMPSRLPAEPVESPVAVLRCYTEMSRILGEIIALIYRRRPGPNSPGGAAAGSSQAHTGPTLIATVHAILQSLTRWEEALPAHLRLDQPGSNNRLSRESISVYLHYYQCISITARPLLFQVVQKRLAAIRAAGAAAGTDGKDGGEGATIIESDWQTGLSKKTVAVIDRCIESARQTILIMAQAATHNMVATYGYMDSEYALSASIVLTLVCGSFPRRPENATAMAQGLLLLQGMGDRGNNYVAARHGMLARLQAILASQSGGAAEPSTSKEMDATDAPVGASGTTISPPAAGSAVYAPLPSEAQRPQPEVLQDFHADAFFAPGTYGQTRAGYPDALFTPLLLEDAESSLWAAAFGNSAGLEFFQFLPETETDMTDYLGL